MGQTFHSFRVGQPEEKSEASTPNRYFKGETPEDCAFSSRQEMIDAMSSDLYANDAEYRACVAVMVANSDFSIGTHNNQSIMSNEEKEAKRQADWRAEEDAAILKEHVQSLMNDPRYETSTLFRRQVREQIEQNQAMIEKVLPSTKGPTRLNGRIQFTGEDYAEVQAGLAKEREGKQKAAAKAAAEQAARDASQTHFDIVPLSNVTDEE